MQHAASHSDTDGRRLARRAQTYPGGAQGQEKGQGEEEKQWGGGRGVAAVAAVQRYSGNSNSYSKGADGFQDTNGQQWCLSPPATFRITGPRQSLDTGSSPR